PAESQLQHPATGQPASKRLEVSRGGMTAYFSPDGQRVLVDGHKDHKPIAQVWDWRAGKPLTQELATKTEGSFIWFAYFSPCGRRIPRAVGGETAPVWGAATGEAPG